MEWANAQHIRGEDRDQIAANLAHRLGIDYQELRAKRILQLMNLEEVKHLALEGVDFQLHTHRHRTPLSEQLFRREIRDNRTWIANAIRGRREHFCYPRGTFRAQFLDWLVKEADNSPTTSWNGLPTPQPQHLLVSHAF